MQLDAKQRNPLHYKAGGKNLGERGLEGGKEWVFSSPHSSNKMVLARGCLPACSWRSTYSSKLVGTGGEIWTDMHLYPTFWGLSSEMSACRCLGEHTPGWDHTSIAEIPSWILWLSSRKRKGPSFPLRAGGQSGCSRDRNSTVVLATCCSLHLWLSLGTLELFVTHSTSLHTGKWCCNPPQTNWGPLVWEWPFCGFKKELVRPTAEKSVDSAVFLPHFPFCSDLTPPQCYYSCRWSETLHTKVSFSHINMNI